MLYSAAIASISHRTFLGSVFTATQDRAGRDTNASAYTALKAAKSLMSARKQVVFTTLSNEVPLASRIAPTLATLWRACSSMVAPAISPVAGSMGIWPEVNSRFLRVRADGRGCFFCLRVFDFHVSFLSVEQKRHVPYRMPHLFHLA